LLAIGDAGMAGVSDKTGFKPVSPILEIGTIAALPPPPMNF